MKFFPSVAVLVSSVIVSITASPLNAELEARATTTTTLPESCTFKPTQTITATAGCPTNCSTIGQGIADAALVIPCGCTSGALAPTTITVCPTTTACVQFTTGWGLVVVTESPCPASTATASVTAY